MRIIGFFIGMVIALMAIASASRGADIQFTWTPPPDNDLAGFRLYQAQNSGDYEYGEESAAAVFPADAKSGRLIGVTDGSYFWVITAVDESGNESAPSNEVGKTIDCFAPTPPENVTFVKICIEVTQ